MDYFIDSNVVIGYYFDYTDHWGKDALKVFNSQKQIHSGSNVRRECFGPDDNSGRCNTIKKIVLKEFSKAVSQLIRTKSSSELIATAFAEKWRIKDIISDMYSIYEDNISSFVDEIRKVKRKFESDCNKRSEIILRGDAVIFHNRSESYSHIYQLLGPKIDDPDDIEVILDAHHVVSMGTNILFISGDYGHIVKNKTFIVQNTAIEQIIPLGNFT